MAEATYTATAAQKQRFIAVLLAPLSANEQRKLKREVGREIQSEASEVFEHLLKPCQEAAELAEFCRNKIRDFSDKDPADKIAQAFRMTFERKRGEMLAKQKVCAGRLIHVPAQTLAHLQEKRRLARPFLKRRPTWRAAIAADEVRLGFKVN